MLYLIERYAPGLTGVGAYDPARDFLVTGHIHVPHMENKLE
jgi:hypothetical protein